MVIVCKTITVSKNLNNILPLALTIKVGLVYQSTSI